MNFASTSFDFTIGVRRLAEATTPVELETAWQNTQADFERSWERRGRTLLTLIHDDFSGIYSDAVVDILGKIHSMEKKQPIDLVLHTYGGGAGQTEQIASVLVKRRNTAAIVPYWAMSGGTEVALATQKIYLGKGAVLGPTDLQFGGIGPARDIVVVVEELGEKAPAEWRAAAKDAARALRDETERMCGLINRKHKGFLGLHGCKLARELNEGKMHHGLGITLKRAKDLHINVSRRIPKSAYALVRLRLEQLARLRQTQS